MTRPPKTRSGKKMSGDKPSGEKRARKTQKQDKETHNRMMTKTVKTARGRKLSSKLWLERQINDPYVAEAKIKGYRSRAAFKLLELDEKFHLIPKNGLVVDLGAAPGGWTQIALEKGARHVIGIDILPVEQIGTADIIEMDFMDDAAPGVIKERLGGPADFVMSDLAANTTGHKQTDHLRTVGLVEAAADFAMDVLKPGGAFVTKVFQGGAEGTLLTLLKKRFKVVKHAKPKSSRAGSPEMYLVAMGFEG